MNISLIFLVSMPFFLFLEDDPPQGLEQIEAALKAHPDDPMLHYRKCQALFTAGKEQDAVDHAAVALTKFKAAHKDLAWMLLGTMKTDQYQIEVLYNMGKPERAEKKDGILRPYSFRVWTKSAERRLVRTIDFELGYIDGELLTAAIGEEIEEGHANFGVLDPKTNFATVKKKVLAVLSK